MSPRPLRPYRSRRALPALVLLAATLLPAGCKREAATNGPAAGEVLPGSASDAMLPIDRVTSQPPLDPRADRTAGKTADQPDETATDAPDGDGAAGPDAQGTGAAN